MNIKSLLIGSAALLAASSAAKAADAIVMAEPEPMEYVRICDVYGAGFFYIPGTETCMHIGGYYRFQLNFATNETTWFARFAPSFDVRSETEWGTLRGFAEVEFDYGWYTAGSTANNGAVRAAAGYAQDVNLNHAFIELITASGTLRMGKGDAPYARFLGYGNGFGPFGGRYGFANSAEISYTFRGGNGFSAIIALEQDGDTDFMPDIEGGINFAQGWGSVGAIAGYDESAGTWGAKGVLRFKAPNGSFSGGLHVFYSSGAGRYAITEPASAAVAPWSVLAHVRGQFSATVAAQVSAQWFSNNGAWELTAGLDMRPVTNFRIRPEIRYRTGNSTWAAAVRFDREIP